MIYKDLRGFIKQVDELGALRRVNGVDPRFELGGITEVAAGTPECPALLFDRIKGFAPGFRVFTNATTTPQRAALALGIDPTLTPLDALKAWMGKRQRLTPHKPVTVTSAPLLENSMRGRQVDLGKLPAPHWHCKDGGPYIGSGSIVIMRDPDGGWINASIYRVQVHGRNRVTIQFDHPGRHGSVIARKYWDRGKSCPVAVVNGEDPALFIAGFEYLPDGQSEYDFAGAIKGAPIEVLDGPLTGLPLPAQAEIVLEGELLPPGKLTLPEGPFGEFTGYYAAEARPCPVMQVNAVHHRDNPILLGSPPMKPPRFHFGLPFRAASIWSQLEMAGVTDVVGVWQHVAQLMTVVAIRQRYAGHARQAGHILSQCGVGAYMSRYSVVVDEDIDPSNLQEVMWAVATRTDPAIDIDIIQRGMGSKNDPMFIAYPYDAPFSSKAIIDACRPWDYKDAFPPVAEASKALQEKTRAKWKDLL